MKRSTERPSLVVTGIVMLVTAILAPHFQGASVVAESGNRLTITATTGMVADLVANIGGDHVAVTTLLGPGVDPHLYRPSAGDVQRLSDADVVFSGGLNYEGFMSEIIETFIESGKPAFAVSDLIPASELLKPTQLEGNIDPHIWFDVTLWKYAAESVAEHLSAVDPEHAVDYLANRDAYLVRLTDLDTYIRDQIATIPESSRVLVTAHGAFGYFGRQYGLEVHSLQGPSTSTRVSSDAAQELADFITERAVKAIFVESSVPVANIDAVRAACRAKGWDVIVGGQLFSDAMGQSGSPEGSYIGMVRHNVDSIVRALR